MIDIHHLCPGCMGRWEDTENPCPRCGFSWERVSGEGRELPPFTILAGRYLLGRKVGAGGFGITYIAMDLEREETVAVKEFFPVGLAERKGDNVEALPGEEGKDFRSALRSFQKEAELLSRFSEVEGIVRYRDTVQENQTAYLVMDYVEGINLKQQMRQMEKPFSQAEALRLMVPILLAVDTMHRGGVLHRDISPENLIRKPDGTLTLIDFGAAREYAVDEEENLTVILKRGYAPDEQYHYGSRQGPWTDLYACCAVLYQMVSGIRPQDASDRRKKDELLPLDAVEGVEVTEAFARAIEKGMTIYATERYSSIELLLADLAPERMPQVSAPAPAPEPPEAPEESHRPESPEESHQPEAPESPEAPEGSTPAPAGGKRPFRAGILLLAAGGIVLAVSLFAALGGSEGAAPAAGSREESEEASRLASALPEESTRENETTVYAPEVPDVRRLSLEEARQLLEPDFSVEVQFAADDSAGHGQVISQSLAPGETVVEGTEITLTVALADLAGMDMDTAEQALTELGLEASVEHRYSTEVEEGCVMEFRLEGEQAVLVVSDGPEIVQVPDVRGLTEEEAQQAAADLGLTAILRNDQKFYSEYSRGLVAYQQPDPGTEMEAGSYFLYDTSAGVPSRGSETLEASTTSVTLSRGGDAVAVTFYTDVTGGCVCYTPAGIDAQMGDWYEGQPFRIYLSASEEAASGMTHVYIYTGKQSQGTDVVVDYVNIQCTVVDG